MRRRSAPLPTPKPRNTIPGRSATLIRVTKKVTGACSPGLRSSPPYLSHGWSRGLRCRRARSAEEDRQDQPDEDGRDDHAQDHLPAPFRLHECPSYLAELGERKIGVGVRPHYPGI